MRGSKKPSLWAFIPSPVWGKPAKNSKAKKQLAEGVDPSVARKQGKHQKRLENENTFERLAREWHGKQEKHLSVDYWKNQLHRLEMDIFPLLGKWPVRDITALDLLEALQKIETRGAHEMARRCLQMCGQVFRYGVI